MVANPSEKPLLDHLYMNHADEARKETVPTDARLIQSFDKDK